MWYTAAVPLKLSIMISTEKLPKIVSPEKLTIMITGVSRSATCSSSSTGHLSRRRSDDSLFAADAGQRPSQDQDQEKLAFRVHLFQVNDKIVFKHFEYTCSRLMTRLVTMHFQCTY